MELFPGTPFGDLGAASDFCEMPTSQVEFSADVTTPRWQRLAANRTRRTDPRHPRKFVPPAEEELGGTVFGDEPKEDFARSVLKQYRRLEAFSRGLDKP